MEKNKKNEKNEKIRQTGKETRERRKTQTLKTLELKVDKSRLSAKTVQDINHLFLEAKWFSNYVIEDIFHADYKTKIIQVHTPDGIDERPLNILPAQVRHEIINQLQANVKTLSTLKKKGFKVGRIWFKSRVQAITFPQYDSSHRIVDKNHIKLANIKQYLSINGLDQIPIDAELGPAKLIRKHGDLYIHLTIFVPKEPSCRNGKEVGFDLGIEHQITTTEGIYIDFCVPPSKKLRQLHRELSRKKEGSNNYRKTQEKLQKEYAKLTNIKQDIRHKVVHYYTENYEKIYVQDENLKAWQRLFGKKIEGSALGGLMRDLKRRSHTLIERDRFEPTTQLCCKCGHRHPMTLKDRTYVCDHCGLVIPRDYNSSWNMVGTGRIEPAGGLSLLQTPVEIQTSTLTAMAYLRGIPYVKASLVR